MDLEVSHAKTSQKYHVLHSHTVASVVRNTRRERFTGEIQTTCCTGLHYELNVKALKDIFCEKHKS